MIVSSGRHEPPAIGDNEGMICASCRARRHEECPARTRGGSWCDCQHLPGSAVPEDRRTPAAPGLRDGGEPEPGVNWKRQG